jgi:NAD(P)-dependent dehydrogenase (short-subunit alcohol dehydrogenase family)
MAGSHVTANAVHPGWVRSRFGMDGDTTAGTSIGMQILRPFQISPARGARTSTFLATSPDAEGKTGMYWVRRKPSQMSAAAQDDAAAERLWEESERLLVSAGFPAS